MLRCRRQRHLGPSRGRAAASNLSRDLVDVVIGIEEFADEATLEAVGLESEWELPATRDAPLSEQSIWSSGHLAPVTSLHRGPLHNERIEPASRWAIW